MSRKPPVVKMCPQCGSEFRRPPSQAGAKFCGVACWYAHHATKEKVCQHCGKTYRRGGHERCQGTGKQYCSAECRSLALRRRVEFRCRDCGKVEMRTPSHARAYQRCAECGAAFRAARLRGKLPLHAIDPAAREKWLIAQRSPERRELMSELMMGRVMATDLTRRDSPLHFKALHFCVKSPAGVTYQVDNLAAFVRGHPEFFEPEDVVNRSRKRACYQSRASSGLAKLRAVAGTRLSWKGWTLAFGWRDDLGRRVLGPAGEATANDGSNRAACPVAGQTDQARVSQRAEPGERLGELQRAETMVERKEAA